ncbi:hypothetical protein RHMOL_Rhmol12G0144700 [Rhododendron molle]|uniref:Uncharacterized protein n=2 Tax=Rhododendron molle TaxID=49168 RepID=A0ACC0LJA6_RHOML|nr:hypothetical protein RHMOL_Rhmol12G0144700 [Rhododendron molle]
MLRTFEPSDHTSDGSDPILATNDREPFIAEMRSEPLDARSDGLEVCSMVLRTPMHNTIPNSIIRDREMGVGKWQCLHCIGAD